MISYIQDSSVLHWLLLIAVIGDFAVPYLLAPFYGGYSHIRMVMSSLGNPGSPVRKFYNFWLIVLGVLLTVSSVVVSARYWLVSKPLAITAALLIIVFAVGAGILSGIFSVNESKEVVTLPSQIHGIGAALGFMALLFVPLLLSILSYKSKDRMAGILFAAAFVFAFLFFVLFVLSDKPRFRHTFVANEGLWQRLSLLSMYFPLGYIAVQNIADCARHTL